MVDETIPRRDFLKGAMIGTAALAAGNPAPAAAQAPASVPSRRHGCTYNSFGMSDRRAAPRATPPRRMMRAASGCTSIASALAGIVTARQLQPVPAGGDA